MAKLVSADLMGDKLCTLTYTTTHGKMLWLKENAFDAKIISHSYTDKGEILFDKPIKLIGADACRRNSLLTSVTIPDSVTSIGEGAFLNCNGLTSVTIPNSVTSIGDLAFSGCTSLTSVTIPNSVTSIEVGAFGNCTSLTAFYGKFASEDNRCLIVDGVLNKFAIGCGLTAYTIPDSVTSIGHSAFSDCKSLTSITIPDSVTEIAAWAFSHCKSLTSITIPNSVTSIEVGAFCNCTSLTSVTIPKSVTEIEYATFADCKSLTSITIGKSVTLIKNTAFEGCNNLATIICKAETPPILGRDAFPEFETLIVPEGCEEAYANSDWEMYIN